MKKPYLTFDGIMRAVTFLEKRKAHPGKTGNDEWKGEYENVLRIIRALCVFELDPEKKYSGRG